MDRPFLSRPLYIILFSLLGLVYVAGLFVPLMDNDSAHHANIALHMYLTGDYVSLVDHAGPYLDKPHLHFWLCALSYNLFGVTGFAYKLPSFLFTIGGVYSVYRLGRALYDTETGRRSALVMASAFAFILANNDVRMDAILVACIAFASWQLVVFVQHKKLSSLMGAALGLALGFSTKGMIGVLAPLAGAFFYVLYRREAKFFISPKWWLLLFCFALFISPVLYCYYRQFNLHPETVVRGQDHINGLKFILLNQGAERLSGEMGGAAKKDYLFFLYTFPWAFAPWGLLVFIAMAGRLKRFFLKKEEWFCTGTFLLLLLLFSFSGSRLPHYLNIAFPVSSVMTAAYLTGNSRAERMKKLVAVIQGINVFSLLAVALILNAWAFPVNSFWVTAGAVLLLALVFYFIKSKSYTLEQKNWLVPSAAMILFFFLLNVNFYPKLLRWQGGNELARMTAGKADPRTIYFWTNNYSSSFNFYTATLRQPFNDTVLRGGKKIWLLYDIKNEPEIRAAGYRLVPEFETPDFEITKLDLPFLDPSRRSGRCSKMVLAEISR